MDAISALFAFNGEMLRKLQACDAKHQESSVMRHNVTEVLTQEAILDHFEKEVAELRASPRDKTEAVDVANMAFLLWWHLRETTKATPGAG